MASFEVNFTNLNDSPHIESSVDEGMEKEKCTHQPQEQLEAVVYRNTDAENYQFKHLTREEELPESNPIFMYLSAITACLLVSSCTSCLGWTSPVITHLESIDPQVNPLGKPVTPLEISWIASLPVLGAAFGPLFTAKLADVVGRKRALIYLSIPHICSLLLLAYATDVRVYYVTRFLSGFVMGSVLGLMPVYLAEIAEIHNRSTVGALITIFLTGGIMYSFLIGPLVSVKAITLCCALPGLIFLIIFGIFMPESPMYLGSRDDIEGTSRVLMKLRRQTADQVQRELRIIMGVVEKEKQQSGGHVSELFKDAGLKKSLVICLGLFVFQQFSGLNVLISFMEQIFVASGTSMSEYVSTNLVALIQFLTSVLAAAIVERFSQRSLLILSSLGTSISLSALALYFYLKTSTSYSIDGIFWLPITSFVSFFILLGLGLAVLPWGLTAEIFPTKFRGTAGSLGAFSCFFSSFLVTLGFPLLRDTFGIAQCLSFFSGCTFISAIFVYYLVPATAGKTSAEIQLMLRK